MKKKILFTFLLAACFVCLLIVSVGAVTYTYNDADGNVLFSFDYETTATNYGGTPTAFIASNKQGNGFAKVDAQGNELTWYITNSQADDAGNKTFTVASLKTVGEAGTINENGVYNFTSPVTNKNTVSVNFPDNAGIKTWGFKSFGGYNSYFNNNILFVYCPNTLTAFENNPFQETPVMVVELEFETPINNIPQNFAHEARNLTSINIPASVEIINGNGPNQGTPFYRNYSLASVNFAPNSVLTTIKQNAFTDCNSLTSLVLPNSVTTIAERAFSACRNLTTIKLGASLKETTGYSVFHTCNSLTVYYIPKTLKTVSQHTFTHDGTAGPSYGVFFYNGTKEELDALVAIAVASKDNNRLTNQYNPDNTTNILEWDPSKPDSYYINMATEQNKKFYIYNYNTCQAFYDNNHAEQAPTYAFSGEKYISEFCSYAKCDRCPNVSEAKVVDALFTSKGYSKSDDAFMYDIKVNFDAIDAYKEFYKEKFGKDVEINYGLVISGNTSLTELLDSDGKENDNVIKMTFDGTVYSNIQIKFMGIVDPEKEINNSNTYIHACAYVIEDENIFYIGDGATDTVSKLICYNDIKNEE